MCVREIGYKNFILKKQNNNKNSNRELQWKTNQQSISWRVMLIRMVNNLQFNVRFIKKCVFVVLLQFYKVMAELANSLTSRHTYYTLVKHTHICLKAISRVSSCFLFSPRVTFRLHKPGRHNCGIPPAILFIMAEYYSPRLISLNQRLHCKCNKKAHWLTVITPPGTGEATATVFRHSLKVAVYELWTYFFGLQI